MKLENTIQAMQNLGGKVVKEGRAILKKKKKQTKANTLYNDFDYLVTADKTNVTLTFDFGGASDYWDFVDEGVRGSGGYKGSGKARGQGSPFSFKKKNIKKGVIEKWITNKPLKLRDASGKFISKTKANIKSAAFVIGRGLQGKTYMSGLDQLMQIAQNPIGPASTKAFANVLNNSVPLAGMRNEFGKWINPHMKELNSDMFSSIRNRNLATEAFAPLTGQKALPRKSDLLNGKPIKNWNIIGRSFNAVSPIQMDVRSNSPGRKLLLDSNYDLKSTTYAYGGYSFVQDARIRAHFQNAIGTVPVVYRGKKFKNVEAALDHLAVQPDIQNSMKEMKSNVNNPAKMDIIPSTYPHNTSIHNIMNQARSKAWAIITKPTHPAYADIEKLKTKKDGNTTRTRQNRNEILELSFPRKTIDNFPKN